MSNDPEKIVLALVWTLRLLNIIDYVVWANFDEETYVRDNATYLEP